MLLNIFLIQITFIKSVVSLNCLTCNDSHFNFQICVNKDFSMDQKICNVLNNKINEDKLIKTKKLTPSNNTNISIQLNNYVN